MADTSHALNLICGDCAVPLRYTFSTGPAPHVAHLYVCPACDQRWMQTAAGHLDKRARVHSLVGRPAPLRYLGGGRSPMQKAAG